MFEMQKLKTKSHKLCDGIDHWQKIKTKRLPTRIVRINANLFFIECFIIIFILILWKRDGICFDQPKREFTNHNLFYDSTNIQNKNHNLNAVICIANLDSVYMEQILWERDSVGILKCFLSYSWAGCSGARWKEERRDVKCHSPYLFLWIFNILWLDLAPIFLPFCYLVYKFDFIQ